MFLYYFATITKDNTITVIDTFTNNVIATIPVGKYPWGVAISPDGTKLYATNFMSNTVSVINRTSNTVTATIPVGEYPNGVAVTPDGSKAYVINTDGTFSIIDTATNKIKANVEVGNKTFVFGKFIG